MPGWKFTDVQIGRIKAYLDDKMSFKEIKKRLLLMKLKISNAYLTILKNGRKINKKKKKPVGRPPKLSRQQKLSIENRIKGLIHQL